MLLSMFLVSGALGLGQADPTLDDVTQCWPSDVTPHPAEKTVIENLLKSGPKDQNVPAA